MSSTPRQRSLAKKPAHDAVAAPQMTDQAQVFERAIAAFHARKYAEAASLFAKAEQGPNQGMAHSARLHSRICERRMQAEPVDLRTADDHYNYGIALLNERRLTDADRHLRQAAALAPRGDHIYYALALCLGLRGDVSGACANLKRAIDIDPRNRVAARKDPDFAELLRLSPIAELLYPVSAGV